MSTVEQAVLPLERGDFLSREEFLRRWKAMPQLKRAELIRIGDIAGDRTQLAGRCPTVGAGRVGGTAAAGRRRQSDSQREGHSRFGHG